MRRVSLCLAAFVVLSAGGAGATDLTLTTGGRVSIELISSEAAFRNTLAVGAPAIGIAARGCLLEPATGLIGTPVLSEKTSQRGCRVELDADAATAGIQPFASGTVFDLRFCAQTDADVECEFVWASNPASNSDAFDHLRTTALSSTTYPGRIFRLEWEDTTGGGDLDFNDLVAVLRVDIDSDGDGLWDDWETVGIDSNADGTIDLDLPNTLPVDLNADGDTIDPGERTSPNRKDVFLEIDSMDCAQAGGDCPAGDTHNHRPKQAAINLAVQAFRNANVTNPDGSTGITLHIDNNDNIRHQNFLVIPNACFTAAAGTGFDQVKNDSFGPANPRRFAFHYALFTHRQTNMTTSSGCGELPGNDFQVSLGSWNLSCAGGVNATQPCTVNSQCPGSTCLGPADIDGDGLNDQHVGTVRQQAGTLLHEFGHNLNLGHGGGDWLNNKPNYLSVMNYSFQMAGVPPTPRFDYSRAALATLSENSLNEPAGIGDGTDTTSFFCQGSTNLSGATGNGAVDWNCDADGGVDLNLSRDINADAALQCVRAGPNGIRDTATAGDDFVSGTSIMEGPNRQCDTTASGDDWQWRPVGPLTGYWDWNNLQLNFQTTRDFDDGTHTPNFIQLQELDHETYAATIAPDPAVSLSVSPNPVVTGSNVTYQIVVSNVRPAEARNITITDNLPGSVSFVSCSATGGGVCGGSGNARTVTFASIPGGGSATVTIVAAVNCNLADDTSFTNIVTLVSVPDADNSNNSASVSVVTLNPPPVITGASVSVPVLWPPNHKMVEVAVNYVITDNCPAALVNRTLSITSNEPVNGTGDGDASPDWEVIDATRVRLRAERSGGGNGRTYTITITATDSGGASSSKSVTVSVPKNGK